MPELTYGTLRDDADSIKKIMMLIEAHRTETTAGMDACVHQGGCEPGTSDESSNPNTSRFSKFFSSFLGWR